MGMYDANDGRPGVVYILANEALREGVYKIGQSTRSGHARAQELNAEGRTGMPSLYRCVFEVRVDDCGRAEKLVHMQLYASRMNKEFFRVDLAQAKLLIERVCRQVNGRDDLVVRDTDSRGKHELLRSMTLSNHRISIEHAKQHMLTGAPISSAFFALMAFAAWSPHVGAIVGIASLVLQEGICAWAIFQSSRVLRASFSASDAQ
jgi:hypothetical protein